MKREKIMEALKDGFKSDKWPVDVEIQYVNGCGESSTREITNIEFGPNGRDFRAFCRLRGEERQFRLDRVIYARSERQQWELDDREYWSSKS